MCLQSLIQHFGKCPKDFKVQTSQACKMCLQLFRLIQIHIMQCLERTEECPILVCRKISFLVQADKGMLYTKASKIWKKLKKHMMSYIDSVMESIEMEEEEYFSMTPLMSVGGLNPPLGRSLRISTTFSPNLPFIPEDNRDRSLNIRKPERPLPMPMSKSEPIARKTRDGGVEILSGPSSANVVRPRQLQFPETGGAQRPKKLPSDLIDGKPYPAGKMVSPMRVMGPPDGDNAVLSPTGSQRPDRPVEKRPLKVSFSNEVKGSRKLSGLTSLRETFPSLGIGSQQGAVSLRDIDSDAFPEAVSNVQPTEHEEVPIEVAQPSSISELSEGSSSLGAEKTYGQGDHIMSMPMGMSPWRNDNAPLLSLKERPTGYPGIGKI